jgi:hypothetical protein
MGADQLVFGDHAFKGFVFVFNPVLNVAIARRQDRHDFAGRQVFAAEVHIAFDRLSNFKLWPKVIAAANICHGTLLFCAGLHRLFVLSFTPAEAIT